MGLRPLIDVLRARFLLEWNGLHGAAHWARVRSLGLRLAAGNGARADVVELFSCLHDARREDDLADPGHGPRAVELAHELRGSCFELDRSGFELLCVAIEHHSGGSRHDDVTVQTCWDADRLDLSRIGVRPKTRLLAERTGRERELLDLAWRRGQAWRAWKMPRS